MNAMVHQQHVYIRGNGDMQLKVIDPKIDGWKAEYDLLCFFLKL